MRTGSGVARGVVPRFTRLGPPNGGSTSFLAGRDRGAYGRLNAWQSVSALEGAGLGQGFESVVDLAERSRWFSFETDSGWFYDVAWDIGLAAISADGGRLTVLAASDTD